MITKTYILFSSIIDIENPFGYSILLLLRWKTDFLSWNSQYYSKLPWTTAFCVWDAATINSHISLYHIVCVNVYAWSHDSLFTYLSSLNIAWWIILFPIVCMYLNPIISLCLVLLRLIPFDLKFASVTVRIHTHPPLLQIRSIYL